MGTWSEKIKGNDTTLDIYSNFFDQYNNGATPPFISQSIREEYADYFSDSDDGNNSLFGLGLAQWESKSLEPSLFKQIKDIINNGNDLKVWKGLGADEISLKKRQTELENFLVLISEERPKAKRRVRPKFEFTTNEIVRLISPDLKKEFVIQDEFANGEYIHTSGIMKWFSGGGSGILYHNKPNSPVKAKWIGNQTLELIHEMSLKFTKKEVKSNFRGDEVIFKYDEE